jgi:hypothetical protein
LSCLVIAALGLLSRHASCTATPNRPGHQHRRRRQDHHHHHHHHHCPLSPSHRQAYGVKVFDLLGEQGMASEAAMAIYAEFHAEISKMEQGLAEKNEKLEAIKAEEATLFKK